MSLPVDLAHRLCVRLRCDPGDELLIDGKWMKAVWPASFTRVGPDIMAEVVIDLPEMIQSFPMDMWTGTGEQLLHAAWVETLKRTPFHLESFDAGLAEPLYRVTGEAPYVTAFALCACTIFGPPKLPPSRAALVAVPTPDYVLLHFFKDDSLPDKDVIAQRMGELARDAFDACDQMRRISPRVYLSFENKGLILEDAGTHEAPTEASPTPIHDRRGEPPNAPAQATPAPTQVPPARVQETRDPVHPGAQAAGGRASLRAVARPCARCERRIDAPGEGGACEVCRRAFHYTCAASQRFCPDCGTAFGEKESGENAFPRLGRRVHPLALVPIGLTLAAMSWRLSDLESLPSYDMPVLGFIFLPIGLLFAVCATAFRDFVVYRWHIERAVRWYGEPFTHAAYLILGLGMTYSGVFMLLGRRPF